MGGRQRVPLPLGLCVVRVMELSILFLMVAVSFALMTWVWRD